MNRTITSLTWPNRTSLAKLILLFLLVFGANGAWAQTTILTGTTIQASTIPVNNTVTINAGGTLNMDVAKTFSALTTVNAGTSTVSGTNTVTITGAVTIATSNTLSLNPNCTAGSLTSNYGSTTPAIISGSGTLTTTAFTIDGGTPSGANGNFTIDTASTVICATINKDGGNRQHNLNLLGTIKVSSTITAIDIITCSATSLFEYTGTVAQSIYDVVSPGYGNLTLTNNSIKTASGALDIQNDFTINTTATFAGGTSLTHNIQGDWTNNGAFTFTTGSIINFNGNNALQTISGTSTTTFGNITVAKTSQSNILEATGIIAFSGATNPLVITSGTFKLSSASTITPFTTGAGATIPAAGGLWNNGGTINSGGFSWTITTTGLFQNSAGTTAIGSSTGNSLIYGTGSKITIGGGAVNVAGRICPTTAGSSTITYNQSGGTVTVCTVGSASTSLAAFDIGATGSSFTMSGGTIATQVTSSNASDYLNLAATTNVTGGTLQIGNTSTSGSPLFVINSSAPIFNLTINPNGTPTARLLTNALIVKGNVTIGAGTTLDAGTNSINMSVAGDWTNNGGTFTQGAALVTFNSTSVNQAINGTATTQSFNAITVNKTGRVLTVGGSTTLVNLAAASTVAAGNFTIPTGVTLAVAATLTNSNANGVTINGSFQINQGGFGGTNDFVYGSSSNLIYNYTQTSSYGPVDSAHKYWPATSGPTNVILQMQNTNSINAGNLQMGVARTITGTLSTSNANNRTMTFDLQTFAFQSANITTGATSNLTLLGAAAITATGNVTVNNASTFLLSSNAASQLNIGGNLSVGNATASGTFTSNGRGTFFTGSAASTQVITKNNGGTAGTQTLDYLIISGTQNVQLSNSPSGQTLALNANTGALQFTNSGSLDLNGQSVTQAGGSIVANGATGGTAKSITSGSAATYTFQTANGSITSAGSGTIGFGSNITVVTTIGLDFGNISGSPVTTINGIFRINSGGVVLNSSAPIYGSGSTLNINNGGNFGIYDNANTREAAGWFRNVASSGSAQHGVPWNFSVTGSGTNVFYNAVNDGFFRQINGKLTIGSGATFSLGGGSGMDFYLRGDFDRTGTFNNSGRSVTFNGTAQSITTSTTFQDLILANSSTKTFAAAMTISGNLNINTGVKADLGTFVSTAGSLTTGGTGRTSSTSYGGTGSPAANIDTTYFSANSGYLNVGGCGAYSLTSTVAAAVCLGGSSSITLANSTTSNLPTGTYTVFYTLTGANSGSFSTTMTVTVAGTGSFTTVSPLSNSGSTNITIDYLVNGCVSKTIAGNTASITINAVPVGPTITKNPNVTTVCAGATLTISITAAGTGGAVSSQDEYRYDNGSGFSAWSASIPSFAAVAGTNTIESRRTSTGSGCTTALGNTVSWTVNAVPVGPVIAKNPNVAAVCAGATLTISVTTAGTGGAISSQDEYRYDNGSGFTAWSASIPSFAAVAGTNTVESRRTSTGSGCTTALGNTVSWTVNAVPVGPVIAKNPNVAAVCAGATLTISVTTAGTGGAISSQDEYRYDSGSGFTAWSASIPSFAAVVGTNTVESRRTSTGSGCTTALGNTVSWTVNAVPVGPVIAKNPNVAAVCAGATLTISVTTAGTGGAISSQDEYRYDNGSGFTAWSASIPSFTAVVGTNTVESRRTSTGSGCTTALGNTVSWTVNAVPVGPVIAKNPNVAALCAGATLTISVTTAGTGGAISSQDEYRYDNGSGFTAWSASIPSFAAVVGTNTVESRRTSTGSGCTTALGNTVSWTVNAVPVGPVIAKNPNVAAVCAGATLTISVTTAGTGGAISSQDEYRYDDGSGFTAWSTSIPSFTAVAGTNTVESRRTSTGSGCTTALGNTVSWTVNAVPVGPVIAKNPNVAAVCAGATLTISVTTAGTGGAISSQDEYRYDNGSGFTAWSASIPSFAAVVGTNTVESRRTSTGSGCTTALGNTVSWTVNAVPVGPVIAKNPNVAAVCAGATLTISVTTAGTGGAISSQDEYRYDDGSGFTAWSASIPSFAAVVGTNTVESRRTSTGSGCTTALGNTVSWTVNAVPVGPVIAKNPNTSTECAGATLSISVTTAGTGGAISSQDEFRYDDGSGFTAWSASIPSFTAVVGTNTVESRRTSTGSGCTTAAGNTVSWTVTSVNTWTGGASTTSWTTTGNWSCGSVPTSASDVVIGSSSFYPVIASDVSIHSLTLNSSTTLKVDPLFDLTVTDVIDNNGTLTIENSGNLIQVNNVTNTGSGSTIVMRDSNPLIRFDYTLWSSPVTGQGLYAFSKLTFPNRFYKYDSTITSPATTGAYSNSVGFMITGLDGNGVNGTDSNNVQFATGTGYLIRLPWNHPTSAAIWHGKFTGRPNNGTLNVTITDTGDHFNAVGNPYPSTIDIANFATDNSLNIESTLYFWRKTNNAAKPSYCAWNTATGTFGDNNEAYSNSPLGVIQTGQGFFVEAKTGASNLVFNNTQRIGDNANQFFKSSNAANNTSVLEANRIWLNMTNASSGFSQSVIGYFTNSTLGVDDTDSKYFNDGPIAFTSTIADKDYVIQGRPVPFDANDVVPMKFAVTAAGTYSIAIDHVDGLFSGGAQSIYLKDNLTTALHDLNTGAYTFTSAVGSFNNRFEIVYKNPLGVENPTFNANHVVIYSHNNEFIVNSGNIIMASIKVFDIRGRLVEEKTAINANQTTIKGGLANEVLLVQITSEDGIVVTKKVIR